MITFSHEFVSFSDPLLRSLLLPGAILGTGNSEASVILWGHPLG